MCSGSFNNPSMKLLVIRDAAPDAPDLITHPPACAASRLSCPTARNLLFSRLPRGAFFPRRRLASLHARARLLYGSVELYRRRKADVMLDDKKIGSPALGPRRWRTAVLRKPNNLRNERGRRARFRNAIRDRNRRSWIYLSFLKGRKCTV